MLDQMNLFVVTILFFGVNADVCNVLTFSPFWLVAVFSPLRVEMYLVLGIEC